MCDKTFEEQLKEWRKYLHTNAESAFEEKVTAAFVAEKLREMGLEVHENVGITGVVGSLTVGDGKEVIGLRADMDAIQMEEQNDFSYKSKNPQRMHACGHDGHTTTLLGAAKLLSERRDFNGTVRFIFQPAEEPGKGANAMLEDGLLQRFPMNEIYGLHNMVQVEKGTIHTRAGGIMASEDNFVITIKTKGSHASTPHLGIDPLVIASEIILGLQTIVSRNMNPLLPAVISCTEMFTDGVRNAIPTTVVIKGDTRSCDPVIQKLIEDRMRSISEGICHMHGADCIFEYTHEFAPTYNWEKCVNTAVEAAKKVVGEENVVSNCEPLMGSEDFGAFLNEIPGCFVFLGGAKSEDPKKEIPLHNSLYDYNEDILVTGAEYFAELIRTRLPVDNE